MEEREAPNMTDIVWVIFVLVVGGLLGWYWTSSHLRSDFLKQVDEVKQQGARAAESAKHRLSAQVAQKEHELSTLRSRLEEERQATLVTQSRLQADYKRASEEKAQLEKATAELAETVNALRAELHAALVTQSRLEADYKRASEEKAQLEKATAELTETVNVLRAELRALSEEGFRELEQFHDIGASLKRAIETYGQVVGAMESRLQAEAQRLKELQGSAAPPSPSVKPQGLRVAYGAPSSVRRAGNAQGGDGEVAPTIGTRES